MMAFEFVDRYLLTKQPSKESVVAQLLKARAGSANAAPFYRALEALGPRTPDEALIALRIILAGKPASDDAVRRLRDIVRSARAQPSDELARKYQMELAAGP